MVVTRGLVSSVFNKSWVAPWGKLQGIMATLHQSKQTWAVHAIKCSRLWRRYFELAYLQIQRGDYYNITYQYTFLFCPLLLLLGDTNSKLWIFITEILVGSLNFFHQHVRWCTVSYIVVWLHVYLKRVTRQRFSPLPCPALLPLHLYQLPKLHTKSAIISAMLVIL